MPSSDLHSAPLSEILWYIGSTSNCHDVLLQSHAEGFWDKVERTFLLGPRARDPVMRHRFSQLYKRNLPPRFIDLFICCCRAMQRESGTRWREPFCLASVPVTRPCGIDSLSCTTATCRPPCTTGSSTLCAIRTGRPWPDLSGSNMPWSAPPEPRGLI